MTKSEKNSETTESITYKYTRDNRISLEITHPQKFLTHDMHTVSSTIHPGQHSITT